MIRIAFRAIFLLLTSVSVVCAQNLPDDSAAAKAFIDALAGKNFAAAYEYFSSEVKAQLPAGQLPQLWTSINAQYGEFKSRGKFAKLSIPQGEKILTVCEFEKAFVTVSTVFDENGKIQGFFFEDVKPKVQAKYEAPGYIDASSFSEREVSVGSGEYALPATLTLPKRKTSVPAMVLVHGSGPNDRDETGQNPANKIFRDLAWGLASRGIAVLRYDKRTLVHGAKMVAAKQKFTVNEETVDDALAAVELLRNTPEIDRKKIYVLGHSLGGYLIPRIGERDSKIAGLIALAGSARPLEDLILEQNIYLSQLDGSVSKEDETALEQVRQLIAKVKSLKPADANTAAQYFAAPVSYWLDLQNYEPLKTAARLKQPLLILQGEDDFQVTMTDFEMWKTALGNSRSVTLKSYTNLTHYFMTRDGQNKPSLADYRQTNHVSETVIKDIADWIWRQK